MENKNIFFKNDFDPEKEISDLIAVINEKGIPIDFIINGSDGYLSLHNGKISLENIYGNGSITVNGEHIYLSDFSLEIVNKHMVNSCAVYTAEYVNQKYNLLWKQTIFVRKNDILSMVSLKNIGEENIVIKDWEILNCDNKNSGNIFSGFSAKTTFFKWETWNMGVWRIENTTKNYESSNILHLYDPESNITALIGFLTMSRMKASHKIYTEENKGIVKHTSFLGFGEFELTPRQVFNSELCSISFHDDPYSALELWADKVKNIYQPRLERLPPVGLISGWLASTAASGEEPWEKYIMKNAEAVRERLRGFDVDYIWTSQANLMEYIPGNWLHENKNEIPSGLERFFELQKNLGFKPGLWVSPFWFYGEAKNMLKEHYGHLLRDKNGNPIFHESTWGWRYEDDDLPWYHMHAYYLDGSHPDTAAYVRELFSYYHKIGVRYYMLDFLGVVENSVLYDKTKTAYQAGYAILQEIRAASENDTHIQTAVASSPGFTGTIDAARIGRDFGEGRPVDTYLSDWRNATHVRHDLHYSNIKYFLQNITGSYFTHQTLYMNDYNEFTVDKPYPVSHAQIVATTFGLGGSPLMIGDSVYTICDERLRYLKLCLPRTAHSAKPVDLFERVQPYDHSRILKLEINTEWDSYILAGVYNTDENPYELTLDFKTLGLEPEEKYVVYDFWNEEYCGVFKKSFPCQLQPESCKLYRISKKRSYPWLLSTDMHIQQGYCEVTDIKWTPDIKQLVISVTRPIGEKGNIYILMPRNYKLLNNHGVHLLKELLDFNVIIQIPVTFSNEIETFTFNFEEWETRTLSPRGHIPYSTKEEWLKYMEDNYHKQDTRVFE